MIRPRPCPKCGEYGVETPCASGGSCLDSYSGEVFEDRLGNHRGSSGGNSYYDSVNKREVHVGVLETACATAAFVAPIVAANCLLYLAGSAIVGDGEKYLENYMGLHAMATVFSGMAGAVCAIKASEVCDGVGDRFRNWNGRRKKIA